MKLKLATLVAILALANNQINAQGCSDAGFCTLDIVKPIELEEAEVKQPHKHTFKAGLNIGSADNDITVFGQYLEYNYKFSEKFSATTKLTAISQSGNNISNFGLSDLLINANYKFAKNTTGVLGFKIPFTNGNDTDENRPLPMDYQSSLGTYDIILGVSQKIKNFQVVVAYQQPLNKNENTYFSSSSLNNSPFIFSTNEFDRAADVLLRVSYPVKASKSLVITPSILPIYHVTNDKYTDLMGNSREIEGSQGLTLNANIYLDYQLKNNDKIQFSLAAPLAVREARPDGLTRGFVANIEYSIRF